MRYSILFEPVNDPGFPPGYFYAHIPVLDLTTHGLGIQGAKEAALDLIRLWVGERRAQGESVPIERDTFFSTVEIEDALIGA